jgi:hypothetical protein
MLTVVRGLICRIRPQKRLIEIPPKRQEAKGTKEEGSRKEGKGGRRRELPMLSQISLLPLVAKENKP